MKKFLLVFALLMTAASAGAQDGFPVRPGIWRLDGIDPDLGTADLEPLRKMIGRAQVVGLGESYHNSGGFYVLKHRVFRFLVEEMGFRVLALETPWGGAEAAARYVQTCEGTPEAAIGGHFPVWQGTELRDLVQWMCEWNRAHPDPVDKVHYFGFDIQQPAFDAPALIAFLQRIGIAAGHPWVEGIRSCEAVEVTHPFGEVPPERHARCVRALTAIDAHFQRNRADIQRQTSERDLTMARLHLVGLRAWEDSIYTIFDDFATGFTVRDEAMAYTVRTLRALRAPKARTAVWAANSHVARSARLPNGERPMGSFLAAALGPRNYVSFGIVAHQTEINPAGTCRVVDLAPGSIEEQLSGLGEETLLVDMKRNTYLRRGVYTTPMFRFRPHVDYDFLFFLERSEGMRALGWAHCPG